MPLWILPAVAAVVLLAAAPVRAAAGASKVSPPADAPAFAADLYAQVSKAKGNLFFSPTSINTALAMTYAGAKGPTGEQMAKALHYQLPADKLGPAFATLIDTLNHAPEFENWAPDSAKSTKVPAYQLVVANALWPQQNYPLTPDFTRLLEKNYKANLIPLDFGHADQARATINTWVADKTKDKIKDLIAPGVLTPATRLVLTNAVYFKSNWSHEFSRHATKDGPFKLSAEKSVDVPLMHQQHSFNYGQTDDLQILELPYRIEALSMLVILPTKADGLPAVEKQFSAANLAKWTGAMQSQQVKLTLPKFTFSTDLALADTLKAMGITDAFDPAKADFSGMTSAEKFFISAVIHKAFVAVDEEGTEAAAATAVMMAGAAMRQPEEPKIFTADHPFLFLIRHNPTGEILFLGRLADPKGP